MHRPSPVRYTYRDLLDLPEGHQRHEIIDGALFVTPTPRVNHQLVAARLQHLLGSWAEEHGLGLVVGPVTVHLEDELVLEPDVLFVRGDRLHIVDPEGHVHGPPDLVVEILSATTEGYDRNLKRKRYLASGVAELWLVDLATRSVEVWRTGASGPEQVADVIRWTVGGRWLDVPLEEVFAVMRQRVDPRD